MILKVECCLSRLSHHNAKSSHVFLVCSPRHPDKNKSPEAATRFQEIQEAYDCLSDAESRRIYERYGLDTYRSSSKNNAARQQLVQMGDSHLIMGTASFYVLWAVLTWLLTLGKQNGQARTWSYIGNTWSRV
jgi:curved DNA-binding protein CbpA